MESICEIFRYLWSNCCCPPECNIHCESYKNGFPYQIEIVLSSSGANIFEFVQNIILEKQGLIVFIQEITIQQSWFVLSEADQLFLVKYFPVLCHDLDRSHLYILMLGSPHNVTEMMMLSTLAQIKLINGTLLSLTLLHSHVTH